MTCLNLQLNFLRLKGTAKRRAFVGMLLVGVAFGPFSSLLAAPVTLAFDAQITNVPSGNPFDLPLTFQVGDTIHGKFAFDPGHGIPVGDNTISADQAFKFEFNINGTTVSSSKHHIRVANDTAFDDSPFPEPIDVVTFGCFEPSCIPDLISLPTGEPFRVRSRIQLVGLDSILAAPSIPADVESWNAFHLERRLNLNFDNDGPGAIGFQATIGSFELVPEPTGFSLAATTVSLVIVLWFFNRHRHWRRIHPICRVV